MAMIRIRTLVSSVIITAVLVVTDHAASLPQVEILYPAGGSLLDRLCESDFHVSVDPLALQAAVALRPTLQAEWDQDGPAYLTAALETVGLPFPYHEMQAVLTVCLPASTSVPLLIDVRPFLPAAAHPAPAWEFAEVVFHELMHTYVGRIYVTSALMKRYSGESTTTRYHLHVMALERAVLKKLGQPDHLAVIDHDYRSGPDPAYRRAWEIVTDIEGEEPFIAELRGLTK